MPEIKPVDGLMSSPAGKPIAANVTLSPSGSANAVAVGMLTTVESMPMVLNSGVDKGEGLSTVIVIVTLDVWPAGSVAV